MATHLGNGCANEINRHHNPLWPQLSEDLIKITIIADGFPPTKEEVRSFYKVKGSTTPSWYRMHWIWLVYPQANTFVGKETTLPLKS